MQRVLLCCIYKEIKMTKKELFVIVACVVLFALLVVLIVFEKKYPEGGAELLRSIRQGTVG